MSTRPSFAIALKNFNDIYGGGGLPHVADRIGGKVKANIDGGFFENACAIRMSYVLLKAGVHIPAMPGKTVSGADGAQYVYKVKDLTALLKTKLGEPDVLAKKPKPSDFAGVKGILIFDVSGWGNATGHATLWNGAACSDSCYFPNAHQAFFWKLP